MKESQKFATKLFNFDNMTTATTQTRTFRGDRFEITLEFDEDDGFFEIAAKEIETERLSCITDLNLIMSDILVPILDPNQEIGDLTCGETHVYASSPALLRELVQYATDCCEDRDWLVGQLEPALIEDFADGYISGDGY